MDSSASQYLLMSPNQQLNTSFHLPVPNSGQLASNLIYPNLKTGYVPQVREINPTAMNPR